MMQPGGSVHPNPSRLSIHPQPQLPLQLCPSRVSCSPQFPCSWVFQVASVGVTEPHSWLHTAGRTLEAGGAPGTEGIHMGWVVGLERPQEGQQGPCTVLCRTGGTRGEHRGPCMVVCMTRKTTGDGGVHAWQSGQEGSGGRPPGSMHDQINHGRPTASMHGAK